LYGLSACRIRQRCYVVAMRRFTQVACVLITTLTFHSAVAHAEPRGRRRKVAAPVVQEESEEPAEGASIQPAPSSSPRVRARTSRANTSLTLPITLLSVGGVMMLGGGISYAFRNSTTEECDYGDCRTYDDFPGAGAAGMGFIVGGAVISLVGLVVLPIRMIARQNALAMRNSSNRATLAPWFGRQGRDGTSVGLAASLRF